MNTMYTTVSIRSLRAGAVLGFAAFLSAIAASSLSGADAGQPVTAGGAVPAVAASPASGALLERLSNILLYGDAHPMDRPGKLDAAIALGLLGDEAAVPMLVAQLQHSEDRMLKRQVVKSLGWIGSSKAVPALEKALADPSPYLRMQAATALKTITGRDYDYDKTGLPDPAKLREAIRASSTGAP